ncbi:MAG: lamin tail domain-containing protein [Bacteroidales bacterium]|nr:lamin tail domain-containing protein [Bacteroidales bacterium]
MKKIMLVLAAALFTLTGCVKDEVYKGPTSIDKVAFDPAAPTSVTSVTVTVTVSGIQAVTTATLKFGNEAQVMTPDNSGKMFKGTIPAMPDGTEVSFTITIVNEANFTTVSDPYTYKVGDPATDWTKLKLNEVYGAGADDEKFFELYNASDFTIKLTGVTINKDEGLTWTGIDGEEVPAHGFFAIVGGKGTTPRGFSSGFSAKKSVILELFAPDGTKVDTFQRGDKDESGAWGAKLPEITDSWQRIPDGTGNWAIASPTCGEANAASGTDDPDVKQ